MAKTKPKTKAKLELPSPPPASALADSALLFLILFPAKVHVFGEWEGNSKHPLAKGGIKTATKDPTEIKRRCTNPIATGYCVYPGDGLMVIDLDVDKDKSKDGPLALANLAAEHGEKLPQTAYVTSPRGGGSRHLYFRTPKDVVIPSSNGRIALGIDVRGNDGRFWIAGPGSRTAKGKYKWERGPEHVIDAPDWLIEAAIAAGPKDKANLKAKPRKVTRKDRRKDYGQPILWDEHQAKKLVEFVNRGKLIKGYEGPFLEGERDNLTFQLFAEAKNRMIHPDVMLEAVEGSGIDGGLDDYVVERKMQSAYHDGNTQDGYGSKVSRYWLPNHVFQVVIDGKPTGCLRGDPVEWKNANPDKLPKAFPGEPKPDVTSELPPGVTRTFYYLDMLDAIPEPTWIIDGILPESGYILIYGKRSTKKSFTALDMGLSLATGTPYHARDVKRGRVVYFAGEGSRGSPKRVKAWFKARKLNREDYARDFALVPFTPKWDTAQGRDIARQVLSDINEDGPITLVIIDTARRAMSGDENAPTSVGQFLDGVNDICREFCCGYLIVHHEGKDASKGARGGGPFEDDADTVLRFTNGAGGAVYMTCTKQKDDEADWKMTFRADIITLGSEPNGKPITSLALALESESKIEDGDSGTTSSDRERYAAHDAIAIQILKGLSDPFAKRGELAKAVMGEIAPEVRDDDPNKFKKALRAYSAHLTRLSKAHTLWPYIDQKNDKGEALTFRNPKHRGRRAAKPSRRRGALNYGPLSQENDD